MQKTAGGGFFLTHTVELYLHLTQTCNSVSTNTAVNFCFADLLSQS